MITENGQIATTELDEWGGVVVGAITENGFAVLGGEEEPPLNVLGSRFLCSDIFPVTQLFRGNNL